MNVKNYFKRVSEKIDNMSDEEFLELLKEAGIDDCPLADEFRGVYQLKNDGLKKSLNYGVKKYDAVNNKIGVAA
ncbi:hypothetical protein [Natronospora cellulosivora (SeqCode)]